MRADISINPNNIVTLLNSVQSHFVLRGEGGFSQPKDNFKRINFPLLWDKRGGRVSKTE